MRILIHGINFSPELTGIGKYSGEMAQWLAKSGHEVRAVTAPPYYPQWRIKDGFSGWRYRKEKFQVASDKGQLVKGGLPVAEAGNCQPSPQPSPGGRGGSLVAYRCPLWVPMRPSGLKRILHLVSFALSSLPVMLRQVFWRPDVVWVVEPPLFCAPGAWLTARLCGAKAWLHVQDFEIDAAFDLGLLARGWFRRLALGLERWLLRRFDRVSAISARMVDRLRAKGVDPERCALFPNWVNTQTIFPLERPSSYRAELGIAENRLVALYSGNMGEKQGLEIVLEVADRLQHEPGLLFVLCGEGAARERLIKLGAGLGNVRWLPLQPVERLNDLLNLADVHLLPQRADAADLVMPSKLLGMLASGRPVVATAEVGTQVAEAVSPCGRVVTPGDAESIAQALLQLAHTPRERARLGAMARQAVLQWEKEIVLNDFERKLKLLGGECRL